MRKSLRCVLCAVLAVAMLAGVSPAVEAKGKKQTNEPTVIHIADAGDLRDLAANCSLDTWSDNVRVVLDNDISLAGEEFSSIPIFNGVFDGAGHMICDSRSSFAPCRPSRTDPAARRDPRPHG